MRAQLHAETNGVNADFVEPFLLMPFIDVIETKTGRCYSCDLAAAAIVCGAKNRDFSFAALRSNFLPADVRPAKWDTASYPWETTGEAFARYFRAKLPSMPTTTLLYDIQESALSDWA